MTARVGACCLPVAVLAVAGAASSTTLPVKARTVLTVKGHIDAFAQSTNRLAWLRGDATCPNAELFDLPIRHVVRISSHRGAACHGGNGSASGDLAFDGKRVLWQMARASTNLKYVTIFTAALGDRHTRVLDRADFDRHPDFGPYDGRPPPMVGAAGRLVYYQRCEVHCKRPGGVRAVSGRRSHLLFKGTRPVALSLAGGRLAVLEDAIGCCNLYPAWSPDGTKIAWYGPLLGGLPLLVVANANGTNRHVVGVQASTLFPPTWSPDGSRIAFSKRNGAVEVANADGSGETPLAAGHDPAWSPDGTQVAFLRGSEPLVHGNDVFVVRSDGSQERRLTNDGISGTLDPRWSPDGTKLLVVRGAWLANTARAHVIDVASGNVTVLAPLGVLDPEWSPDGRRIAYTTVADGSLRIAVMNADGTNPHLVTSESGGLPSNDGEPAWSPSGDEIAFTHVFGTDQQTQVRVIRSDGSGLRVVSGLGSSTPAWSPSGRIAWGDSATPAWRTGGLFTANPDGTGLVRLAGGNHAIVETHSPQTGKLLRAFTAPGTAVDLALSSEYIAAIVRDGSRLKLRRYRRSGGLLGSSVLPKVVFGLALGGRTVLYSTARRIFSVDVQTGRTRVLAATAAVPVGLSVVGRRAAWAENLRGHARIRELVLPR